MLTLFPQNKIIREWLNSQLVHVKKLQFESVAVYKSDPFLYEDYCSFLRVYDITILNLDEDDDIATTLIVGNGTEKWEDQVLKDFLKKAYAGVMRNGGKLKIYSQEMFLFRMVCGIDPHDAPHRVLREFSRDHTGLEHLRELGFNWIIGEWQSTTRVDPGWGELGLLKYMGYEVGENGVKDERERHRILHRVFNVKVTEDMPISNHDKWGKPRTCHRLKSMASTIAFFIRINKSKDLLELAVKHWTSDLKWLRTTYYGFPNQFHKKECCNFRWPSV